MLFYVQILGYDTFHSLAHHTVIGNQVIVRGTQRKLVSSVIHTLKVGASEMKARCYNS